MANITCPTCSDDMFFTGEFNPTMQPQRYYACVNKHVVLRYDEHEVNYGDYTVTSMWRNALKDKTLDSWKFVGRYPPLATTPAIH